MRIVFRTDASTIIGSGHTMRCLTLARTLRERGCQVLFVCRLHEGHLADRIEQDGHTVLNLPDGPTDPAIDARDTLAALTRVRFSPDWVVVDHYGLGIEWERVVRTTGSRLLVIDDCANQAHDCDVLLDQNLVAGYPTRYDSLLPSGTRVLLGPRYALLQPRYHSLRRQGRSRSPIRRLLIYFGGADQTGLTELTLRAFLALGRSDLEVDVVVTPSDPRRAAILALAHGQASVFVHGMVPSLADLMEQADLAVGAAGSTSWERLCLSLPALVVTLADNQRPIAAELDRQGCVRWLGDASSMNEAIMTEALRNVLGREGGSWFNTEVAASIDGHGADRVADVLLKSFTLREATVDDVDLYYRWANDPVVRQQSFSSETIPYSEHIAWFRASLISATCRMYVFCDGAYPLGQIRFDLVDDVAHISYLLDPAARGRGLAKTLINLAVDYAAAEGTRSFKAKVRHGNDRSATVLLGSGFTEEIVAGRDHRVFHRAVPPAPSSTAANAGV